jgi:hypothetical protein
MKLHDVMRKIGENFDIPEKVIQQAFNYANSAAGQGKEIKEKLQKELTDEEYHAWMTYGTVLILTALSDPEFKKKFFDAMEEQIEKN